MRKVALPRVTEGTSLSVLVIGGAGNLGSHVVRLLSEVRDPAVAYDNLSTGFRWAVLDAELSWRPNIAERLAALFAAWQFSAILHFNTRHRAEGSVSESVEHYPKKVAAALGLFKLSKSIGERLGSRLPFAAEGVGRMLE